MISSSFEKNYPLENLTTYKIGGPARFYYEPEDEEALLAALRWCKTEGQPYLVVGGGSNILVSDNGFPGLVMKLSGQFLKMDFDVRNGTVRTGGAVRLPVLARRAAEKGWAGFEFMSGIPGTVGGAVVMNAGSKDGETQDIFVSARVVMENLQARTFEKANMSFSYRQSMLTTHHGIVVEAVFRRRGKAKPDEIKATMENILSMRKQKQPREGRNCGSIFKNPPSDKSAGWHIERAGMKGKRSGGALIAHEHANWIVNTGGATATDVKTLIGLTQEAVKRKFGIELEREVIFVPEDVIEE